MLNDGLFNNSVSSTLLNRQEKLNGTTNLTQQEIQTPSYLVYDEILETIPTTTQQIVSPIHPTIKPPPNKKHTPFPPPNYNQQLNQ